MIWRRRRITASPVTAPTPTRTSNKAAAQAVPAAAAAMKATEKTRIIRKPVPKLLIPIIGKGQYLTRSLKTANFNEAKRLAPAVLAEFNNIIEQARLRFERAACRDATLAELARLDTLSSDELMRQSPAVLDNLRTVPPVV